jgi:3-hydroxyisobutyrate dehydrogenase-like beta-hydroxyacid dehydrogenase
MRVGFIGLGSMGLPMAQRLRAGGHELTVYARRRVTLEPFVGTDVTIAATPAELGSLVEAVCICVFDAAGVEEVMFGTDGLVDTLSPGAVVAVHGTVAPAQIQHIAGQAAVHGLRVLDAPVSGGAPRVATGELTIMVGGDVDALADVADLFASMSNNVVHLGGVGAGSQAKLINNTLFSAQIALADDAMRAAGSLGVDLDALVPILLSSSSACIASGVRLRAGSLAALADSAAGPTLAKDVALMAEVLGDAPGHELVAVAQRFVAGLRSG